MDINLYMVRVSYDHSEPPINGRLPVRSVDVGDLIQRNERGEWIIPTHYRSQKDHILRQVGLRTENEDSISEDIFIASPDGKARSEYQYDSQQKIWFEPTMFTSRKQPHTGWYGFDRKNSVEGIANAGSARFEDASGRTIGTVHFVPSSISLTDYHQMVADLYHIREELVRNDQSVARLPVATDETLPQLKQHLHDIEKAVYRISALPRTTLKSRIATKKVQSETRFNFDLELKKFLNPGMSFYRTTEIVPSTHIAENQLIAQMLGDLARYSKTKSLTGSLSVALLSNARNERQTLWEQVDPVLRAMIGGEKELDDPETCQAVLHKLEEDVARYERQEQEIRTAIIQNADFSSASKSFYAPDRYVEVEFRLRGIPSGTNSYYHHLSAFGLKALLHYDLRSSDLNELRYRIGRTSRFTSKPNSYFGDIELTGNHIYSHALLHSILGDEENSKQGGYIPLKKITLCGYINPIQGSRNGISLPSQDDYSALQSKSYSKYAFNFVCLTEVKIDGQSVSIPSDPADLHAFVRHRLPLMNQNAELEKKESAQFKLAQFKKINLLTLQCQKILTNAQHYRLICEKAEALLNLPLFAELVRGPRLPIRSTPAFLHDPLYHRAWKTLKAIERQLEASPIVQAERYIGLVKVEQIFEVWSLYKMMHILNSELGWQIVDKEAGIQNLDRYIREGSKNSLKNFSIKFKRGEWGIELWYEPKIRVSDSKYLTPDFAFRFSRGASSVGLTFADAKYRNYEDQGKNTWKEDLLKVAIDKYGSMTPLDSYWDLPTFSSCILHSDATYLAQTLNPYHVLYDEETFGELKKSAELAHKYASFCLTPSITYIFKNWFRSIMEYHLGEYAQCWSCSGNSKVHMQQLFTENNYPKYHYCCDSCDEFWVKNHCRQCRRRLVKHTLNYHQQASRTRIWYVICPACGNGKPTKFPAVSNEFYAAEEELPF